MPKRSFKRKSFKHRPRRFAKKAKKTWRKKSGFRRTAANIATSTETLDRDTFTATVDTGTAPVNLESITLSDFPRSTLVAQNYRFFRIAKVTYQYMPDANTYQAAGGAVVTIPRFISIMNRDANYNGSSAAAAGTLNDLEEMGGKFRQFTKPIKISYVPNVVLQMGGLDANGAAMGNQFTTIKKAPWLSTVQEVSGSGQNNSLWPHFGHMWAVVADAVAVGELNGRIKVTAHFEFKKPLSAPSGT